jgi:hypothetical protein
MPSVCSTVYYGKINLAENCTPQVAVLQKYKDRQYWWYGKLSSPLKKNALIVLCWFNFHGPCIVNIFQYMRLYTVYWYLETALRVSGGTSTHHQEHIQLYLQHLLFVTPLLLSAAIVEELEILYPSSGAHSTVSTASGFCYTVTAICRYRGGIGTPPPIIRSTFNCIYSVWYLSHRYCYLQLSWRNWNSSTHHQEYIQLYLQHLVFVTPLLLSAAIVELLELLHPSSGARSTVLTASGICHTVTAICSYRGVIGTPPR